MSVHDGWTFRSLLSPARPAGREGQTNGRQRYLDVGGMPLSDNSNEVHEAVRISCVRRTVSAVSYGGGQNAGCSGGSVTVLGVEAVAAGKFGVGRAETEKAVKSRS